MRAVDLGDALASMATRDVPDDAASARLAPHLPDLVHGVRRRRRVRRVTRVAGGTALAAVVGLAVGALPELTSGPPLPAPPAGVPTASPRPTDTVVPDPDRPCAEFPAVNISGPDIEGWWSSSPADDDGNVLHDPADWPDVMREHLVTALVIVDTREVMSTWDRTTCGSVVGYEPPAGDDWTPGHVVVLDARTGEVVESFPNPYAAN